MFEPKNEGLGKMIFRMSSVGDFQLPSVRLMRMEKTSENIDPQMVVQPTPLKFNMEPKKHPTEKANHLPNLHFQVPC